MELIQRIVSIIVPVFFIVAVGWGFARRARPDLTVFNRIALDVLTPVLVYQALAGRDFRLDDHYAVLGTAILLILASGLVAWGLARLTGAQPRTLVPVVMFNNSGNMGLPLALLAFGPANFGAAVALFSIGNLLHFSIGVRITNTQARARELFTSPLMIGTVLGFTSAATDIRPPEPIMAGMKLLGDAVLPMMLFALGVRLATLRRESMPLGLLGAFARPLIGLAIAIPLCWALGLEGMQRAQIILFAALPPAVLQFMFAERYGQEPEKVAAMILLGNAVAIFFIPMALLIAL